MKAFLGLCTLAFGLPSCDFPSAGPRTTSVQAPAPRAPAADVAAPVPAFDRPATYDDFADVNDFESVAEAMRTANLLYFPPGRYAVDNPVVIERDAPVYWHGGNRIYTSLHPVDPSQPLFIVKKAPLLNIQSLTLSGAPSDAPRAPKRTRVRAVDFRNTAPVRFELLDSQAKSAVLSMRGPGDYLIAGTHVSGEGWVQTPLEVDHPDARVVVLGGALRNGRVDRRLTTDDYYHAWQKRGWLRIYASGVTSALGRADFRMDTKSRFGLHVIAGIRS